VDFGGGYEAALWEVAELDRRQAEWKMGDE
jgi:hypothetical protein